jgi:hypothetical protein
VLRWAHPDRLAQQPGRAALCQAQRLHPREDRETQTLLRTTAIGCEDRWAGTPTGTTRDCATLTVCPGERPITVAGTGHAARRLSRLLSTGYAKVCAQRSVIGDRDASARFDRLDPSACPYRGSGQGRAQAAALPTAARRRAARVLQPPREAPPPGHMAVVADLLAAFQKLNTHGRPTKTGTQSTFARLLHVPG